VSRYHVVSVGLNRWAARREETKDWLVEQQRGSNEIPSLEDARREMDEFVWDLPEDLDDESYEEAESAEIETRYHWAVRLLENIDGRDCWRAMVLPEGVDPRDLMGVGEYWAYEKGTEEAYNASHKPGRRVVLRARIDSRNIDKAETVVANMSRDHECEVRFLKHAPVWVYDATLEDGTVIEINGWRRA